MTNSKLPTGSNLSKEELSKLTDLVKQQAKTVATKIPLLGAISWLMMQQASTKYTFLSDLEWRIMPSLLLDQAKLYVRDEMPLAYVSWAKLSADVAMRYRAAPHRLLPADWRTGDQIWLIDVFTPFGGATELLQDIREKVFPGQEVCQLGPLEDGVAKVIKWEAVKAGKVS